MTNGSKSSSATAYKFRLADFLVGAQMLLVFLYGEVQLSEEFTVLKVL